MGLHLVGYIVAESPRAFLFQDHFWTEDSYDWMPKSQVEIIRDPEGGQEVQLLLSDWITKQKDGIHEPDFDHDDEPLVVEQYSGS